MKSEPAISVIIPVYNTERYLRKCMDSVCGQTYRNLEIICVNDGSPDRSADILAEYAAADPRVRVITQANAGLAAARNSGLKAATGDYITGVDSDDYLAPDAYARIMRQLDKPADIICFGTQVTDESGRFLPSPYHELAWQGYRQADDDCFLRTNPCFWNKLYHKELIKRGRLSFPDGLIYEDDVFFYDAAPSARELFYVKDKLYFYVQRPGSIMNSRQDWKKFCDDRIRANEAVGSYYLEHGFMEQRKRIFFNFLSDYYSHVISTAPRHWRGYARQTYRGMIRRLGLAGSRQYPINELERPWLRWNPFYHHTPYRRQWSLFWIPVWGVRFKPACTAYRLFGITLFKKRTDSQPISSSMQ